MTASHLGHVTIDRNIARQHPRRYPSCEKIGCAHSEGYSLYRDNDIVNHLSAGYPRFRSMIMRTRSAHMSLSSELPSVTLTPT